MNILTTRSRFTRINMCSSCAHEHASCTPAMSYNLASRKLSYGWQKTRLGERAENIYGQTSGKGLPKNAERQEITMIYFLWWAREECPGKAISMFYVYKPPYRLVLNAKVLSEQLQTKRLVVRRNRV
jgi:hypothetical protein